MRNVSKGNGVNDMSTLDNVKAWFRQAPRDYRKEHFFDATLRHCAYNDHLRDFTPLQWRHDEHDGVSNHQPRDCLFKLIFCFRWVLTHWGRVTHICVSDLTSIGSSPGRRQAIIRTNAGILLIRPLGTNFSEFLVEILIFSFKKMRLRVSSAKKRPFCLDLNDLMVGEIWDFLGIIVIFLNSIWELDETWVPCHNEIAIGHSSCAFKMQSGFLPMES